MNGYPTLKRGASGKMTIPVTGDSLSEYKYFADIKSGSVNETLPATFDPETNTITVKISQDISITLKGGQTASVQIRAINSSNEIVVTEVYGLDIEDTICNEVISYE